MRQLILDDAAMELLASRASGQPVYMGPDNQLLSPGIIDIIDNEFYGSLWQPGDERTRLLVLAGEACSDLVFQAERFKEMKNRRRVIKTMTVPLCSLMDQIHKLLNLLNDPQSIQSRKTWPTLDQENYKNFGRQFRKKRLNGSVRQVRNKFGAHLDQEIIGNPNLQLQLEDCLSALGDTLILFMLILNHRQAFSWIRWLGSTHEDAYQIVETFFEYPLCTRWITDNSGKALDVGHFQLAEDPRTTFREWIIKAVEKYNSLVDEAKVPVPKIWTIPSHKLR